MRQLPVLVHIFHRRSTAAFAWHLLILAELLAAFLPSKAAAAQGGTVARVASTPISGVTAQAPLPDPAALALDDAAARDLIENLFVGLFRYDAAAGRAVPVLASDWSVSADGLTWTFTLRDDIQWVGYNPETGAIAALRPVAAQDMVAAVQRICHPLKPTPASTAMFAIKGCYAAVQLDPLLVSDEQVARLVGVEAPNAVTLVMHLAFPVPYLPSLLTAPEFRPVPREFVAFTPAWPMIASSGPYVLTEYTPGENLTLVRNPLWPDALPGSVTQITLAYTPDPAAAFTAGEADYARLGSQDAPGAAVQRGGTVTVLGFSAERAFVDNLNVRRALAWSLDREALAASADLAAVVVPVRAFTHPGAVDAPAEATAVGYEPEAARAALSAAGYPNCAGIPEIIALGVPRGQEALANGMISQWADVLGCQPALFEVVPVRADALQNIGRALIDREFNTRIHLWLANYTPEHIDAYGGAAEALHCSYGYFYTGIPCGAVDALIELAGAAADGERAALYERIEARLFGPAGTFPVAPLWANARYTGISPALSGADGIGPAWWAGWTLAQ